MTVRAEAPAKINLTLHVTGQREDGYHELDSLVVFAGISDSITASPAPDLRLSVSGPFSDGVPVDRSNLILRAAEILRDARGVKGGAMLTLEKHLPHAAGIGSGSSDAAATLKLLSEMWDVAPLPSTAADILALGADVPVCLGAPSPVRMNGIGETLGPVPRLPDCALVLVNPRAPLPTQDVFKGLTAKSNAPMNPMPEKMDFQRFASWLQQQRNDLLDPAIRIAPEVGQALRRLQRMPLVKAAGMSGSGATCYGLVANMADARHVARAIQVAEMGWWVAPAPILR